MKEEIHLSVRKLLDAWPNGPASGFESDTDVTERIVRPAYLRSLLAEASAEAGVTPDQILGDSTARHLVHARWVMYARAYERGYSFAQIADAYNRDPAGIRHAVISLYRSSEERRDA